MTKTVVGKDADYKSQSKCYQLDHGRWWIPLTTGRAWAAGSMTREGWLVTGGMSAVPSFPPLRFLLQKGGSEVLPCRWLCMTTAKSQ